MHIISCNWLPFYRPCSFASQTFIWFADFLIIAFKRMQKELVLLYSHALLYTRKTSPLSRLKIKKEQPIPILELFSCFRSPHSIHITVSCSFVLRSFHIFKTAFCSSVRFSEFPSGKTQSFNWKLLLDDCIPSINGLALTPPFAARPKANLSESRQTHHSRPHSIKSLYFVPIHPNLLR